MQAIIQRCLDRLCVFHGFFERALQRLARPAAVKPIHSDSSLPRAGPTSPPHKVDLGGRGLASGISGSWQLAGTDKRQPDANPLRPCHHSAKNYPTATKCSTISCRLSRPRNSLTSSRYAISAKRIVGLGHCCRSTLKAMPSTDTLPSSVCNTSFK